MALVVIMHLLAFSVATLKEGLRSSLGERCLILLVGRNSLRSFILFDRCG